MMAASARRVDSPHATTPHDADALHKMAAIAGAASANSTDENTPANGSAAAAKPHRKSAKNGEPPSKPHQHTSESDENDNDDDGDDDDGNDTDDKSKSPSKDGDDGDDDGDDDGKKSTSGGGAKKSRRELPPHTVAILKGWMLSPEHVKHPYPTDEDKQMLLKKTGINMKQLTNWFTNARKRIWKPMMRREHSRQLQSAMEYEKARPRGDVPPFGAVGGAGGPMGGGAPPPGVPMHYRDAPMYPPRPAIRHSFDAGSMPPPGYHPHHHPYDMAGGGPPPPHHPHAYAGGGGAPPPPHPHAAAYPPRVMRSVSESGHGEMDDYIDALRIRKRVHEMSPDAVDSEHGGADKRYRRASGLSPASVKILQDWVAAHAHLEFPVPADSDKLQLSRDTGLDVQQIELWFKNNVGRYGAPLQAPPPQAQPPMQHPHQAYRSIPTRDNPMYPPPPAYGERRSIPSQGNPMFPPRPAARSSIPGAGNPQFPPPPAVRRDSSDGYRPGMPPPGYPGTPGYAAPPHPGYEGDGARPMRTLSVNSGAYGHPTTPGAPSPTIPTPVGAPTSAASGLPSLTGRPMVPGGARPGPSMGQARDSRSHTLDMGQFAESRRRTMNFQDILSSTSSQQPQQPALVAPRPPIVGNGYDAARPPNAENMYPPTEVAAPYAQKMYDQQRSAVPVAPHPAPSGPQADHQAPR